jgi:hypothetical protein
MAELQGTAALGRVNQSIIDDSLKKDVLEMLSKLAKAIRYERIQPIEVYHTIHASQYEGELFPSGEITTCLRCVGMPGDLEPYQKDSKKSG